MKKKPKVAILGAGGYVAAELIELLLGHPQVEIHSLLSETVEEQDIGDIFKRFRNRLSLTVVKNPDDKLWSSDIAFVSKPTSGSMKWVPDLLKHGIRVIDMGAAYRLKNVGTYEETYEKHINPDLLKKAVYGLTEIYRESITTANLVANPGCYPVSVILGCAPLLKNGIVKPGEIIADSYSGITGAGKMNGSNGIYSFVERDEDVTAYSVLQHRHAPEMDQELGALAKEHIAISFVPHLVPIRRGIMSTIYLTLKEGEKTTSLHLRDIRDIYEDAYAKEPFIRIMKEGETPSLQGVERTNFCDIGLFYNEKMGRIVVISAIDNLGKGAAGQAIQNMNVMLGIEETIALTNVNYGPQASHDMDLGITFAPAFSY